MHTIMNISLLGSTGSIGTQALDVARLLGSRIVALTANTDVKTMEAQIRAWRPEFAAMVDEAAARDLAVRVRDLPTKVLSGRAGVCECATLESADVVLNSIVGVAGLLPTYTAVREGKTLALANKESLVAGGKLVTETAARSGATILPVDSEHSAIFQCLHGEARGSVEKIILTASGGPFFGKTREELRAVTPAQALRHPNWDMGAKITIDSATLMNKGLEFIEAMWLFGVTPDQIEVVVHRQSIVHSMVEFRDHAVLAQLGVPDMRIPIQYALTYPSRLPSSAAPLRLSDYACLTFEAPDLATFPCLRICMEAVRAGGLKPCAANAANEEAVALFLQEKIPFLSIADFVQRAAEAQPAADAGDVEEILAADQAARRLVKESIAARS